MIIGDLNYPMGPGFFIFFTEEDSAGGQISWQGRAETYPSGLADKDTSQDDLIAISCAILFFND